MCTKCGVNPTATQDARSKYCPTCKVDVQRERSARRRLDPEYNAKQRVLKAAWKENNREHHLAKHRGYGKNRHARMYVPMPEVEKPCRGCPSKFLGQGHQVYCSPSCKKQAKARLISERWRTDAEYREKCEVRYRKWRSENPDTSRAVSRRSSYRKYGLTASQVEDMLERQSRRCLICSALHGEASGQHRRLCIDHDHVTGKVRGMICSRCNLDVGALEALEREGRLLAAVDYILKNRDPDAAHT